MNKSRRRIGGLHLFVVAITLVVFATFYYWTRDLWASLLLVLIMGAAEFWILASWVYDQEKDEQNREDGSSSR